MFILKKSSTFADLPMEEPSVGLLHLAFLLATTLEATSPRMANC